MFSFTKDVRSGDFLVVQWLRFCTPSVGALGLITGGTRFHAATKSSHPATETWHSQINKIFLNDIKSNEGNPTFSNPFIFYWTECRFLSMTQNVIYNLTLPRLFRFALSLCKSFSGSSDGKESACSAGDLGSIPRLGRSPGEGNGNPLQYSCLENSMDRPWDR